MSSSYVIYYVSYAPATKLAAFRMYLEGKSRTSIQAALGELIPRQSFTRWVELYHQTLSVLRNPEEYEQPGRLEGITAEDKTFMIDLLRNESSLFLDVIRERLSNKNQTSLCIESIHHDLLDQLDATIAKADTAEPLRSLAKKYGYVEKIMNIPAEFFVIVDESAIFGRELPQTSSRSQLGRQVGGPIPRPNPERFSLLAAISVHCGLLAMTAKKDTFNKKHFQQFLKFDLLPRMSKYPAQNSILVCNDTEIFRGQQVQKHCDEAGVRLLYLPPYCPELNPIENCFSAVKKKLAKTQVLSSSKDPTWDIRKTVSGVITEDLCYDQYELCNYNMTQMSTMMTMMNAIMTF